MTMSLARGLTMLNTKKQKRKTITEKQRLKYKADLKTHNKRLRQLHLHSSQMNLDDYIDYIQGYYQPRNTFQVRKTITGPISTSPRSVVSTVSTAVSKTASGGSNPSTSANHSWRSNPNGGTKDWKEQQERIEISKQYAIVPAYNKGPYMVVSKEDLKTAGKKV